MNGFFKAAAQNLQFVAVSLVTIAVMIVIAYCIEKAARKKSGSTERLLSTRKVVIIGMFSAIAGILHCLDFAIPVVAPTFYKLDFSELPALIAGFAFGPVAGVMVEFLKIVVKLLLKSTSTAFVGDLANFLVGCMLVLPASAIYCFKKTRKRAVIGCVAGTVIMTIFGTWFNAVYLLPTFAELFHMPLDQILEMGKAINPRVTSLTSFVVLLVAPVNIIKGVGVSVLTLLVYKRISRVLKNTHA